MFDIMNMKPIHEYVDFKKEEKKSRDGNPYTQYIIVTTLPDKKKGKVEINKYRQKLLQSGFRQDPRGTYYMWTNKVREAQQKIETLLAEINADIHDNGGEGVSDDRYSEVMDAIKQTIADIVGSGLPVETEEKIKNRLEDIAASLADSVDEREATQFIESLFNFSSDLNLFHKYSFQNSILIYAQDPNATKVAPKSKWQELNRQVVDINNTITINCGNHMYELPNHPGRYREYKLDARKEDDDYMSRVRGGQERANQRKIEYIEVKRKLHHWNFDPCPVYDIANTTGQDLPQQQQQADTTNIYGDSNDDPNANALFAIAKKSLEDEGITVTQDPATAGERGWSRNRQINVSSEVSGSEAASVIFDEWAHDLLHHQGNPFYQEAERYFREKGGADLTPAHIEQIKRVQAQTVSAVLSKFYGLPTSFHPKYMQLLQAQGGLESKQLILENLGTIRDVSNHIVTKVKKYQGAFDTTQHQTQQQPDSVNESVKKSDFKKVKSSLENSKSISRDMKETISKYLTSGSKYREGGHLSGLSKPQELRKKSKKIDGVSMGADKNGFYVYTHRARSKSHPTPEQITVKEIDFIESTG